MLRATSKTYNAFNVVKETDANGIEKHYKYDFAGRLISETIQEKRTIYTYDSLGRKESETELLRDGSSLSRWEIHDALGRIIESYTKSSDGIISNRIVKAYDAQGREIESQEWNQAGKAVTTTKYDLFGRVINVTDPLGNSTHTTCDCQKTPKQEVTDALGIKTITTFDPFGRALKESCYDSFGILVEQVSYEYDLNGNKILRRITTENDPIVTEWHYDLLNRLIKTVDAVGTPDQKAVYREYDNADRIVKLIKSDDSFLSYSYDTLGHRTALKSSDGTVHYTYCYDANDNVISAQDEVNQTCIYRSYDVYDQLIEETLPFGHKFAYAYDQLGRTESVVLPDDTKISYHYQGQELQSVKRAGSLCYSHEYLAYDASSNPTDIKLASSSGTIHVDYDLLNRPCDIQAPSWQEQLSYKAHLLKNRSLADGMGKVDSEYAYDAKNQLLSENGSSTHQFEYDWVGNPISYDGNLRKFNSRNALLEDHQHVYTYDSNGNRLSDGVKTFRYDAMDRLIEVKTPEGTFHYQYDAFGRRIARIHNSVKTCFLWQKQQEIGTVSSSGKIEELRILNPFNHAVALELNNTLYVPLHDIFGHVRALLDESGNCVSTYRYSAFGEEEVLGNVLSPWRYAGKRTDAETGLIYFGERYYDPSTLCWLTPDPMEDADGPNLYAYVHNNPLFFVDPDGCLSLSWLSSDWVVICAEVALAATVVGWGVAGIAEGFMAGCSGGITGTAVDLALDAASLYAEGGIGAACAGAETSTISYNICKTIGRVAGAAFSCTPAGKATQAVVGTAKMGMNAAQGAKAVAQTAQAAKQVKNAATVASKAPKVVSEEIVPQILKGNRDWGMNHVIKRHAFNTNAKNVSKFLPELGEKEITKLVNGACKQTKVWEIAPNGLYAATINMKKHIGFDRKNNSTSFLRVILKDKVLWTTYPAPPI